EPLKRPDIELPPEERDREPLLEQEPVTEIPRFWRQVPLLRAAQNRQRLISSAVDHLEEGRTARLARILGPEEQQIGRELDLPIGVSRGLIEISDTPVGGKFWIDSKVHASDHALVGAPIVAAPHVDADDFRRRDISQR